MVIEAIKKDARRISKALEPPVRVADILRPPLPRWIKTQRTGIRKLDELIDLYARHEPKLGKVAELRLNELRILRERMVRRLAEMRPRIGR